MLKSVVSYELNPPLIEQPNDPEHDYISREGFGIAGVLAHMKDSDRESFFHLEARLPKQPTTVSTVADGYKSSSLRHYTQPVILEPPR